MTFEALDVALLALAYFAGSLPTGVLVARALGVDIRAHGSGNMGATNVARTLGKKVGLFVLAVDAAKGYGPTLLALCLARPAWTSAGVALLAVLGHVFPIWLRFRGGKGVATALGAFLALAPVATGLAAAVYLLAFAITRIGAVGSLAATASLPVFVWLRDGAPPTCALAVALFLFILYTHRANLRRLLRGREHRF